MNALLLQWQQCATHKPVLMVFEDLHWIDPTSLELLSRAVDKVSQLRLLLVATARPEFIQPWPNHQHVSVISLSRLGETEGRMLAQGVASKTLPTEVLDEIVRRTDGVPLFIEELTNSILEGGLLHEESDRYELAGPLPVLAIPSTLHASLLARLDRLMSVKNVVQIGAAIGREFSWELVSNVSGLSTNDLESALEKLVGAGLLSSAGAHRIRRICSSTHCFAMPHMRDCSEPAAPKCTARLPTPSSANPTWSANPKY